jgi:hypothetical protein
MLTSDFSTCPDSETSLHAKLYVFKTYVNLHVVETSQRGFSVYDQDNQADRWLCAEIHVDTLDSDLTVKSLVRKTLVDLISAERSPQAEELAAILDRSFTVFQES